MFILRLISQPKVERNLLDKYHIGNWGFRHLLNNMVTKEWNVVSEYAIRFTHLLNNMVTKDYAK